jgi:hypothetical protein
MPPFLCSHPPEVLNPSSDMSILVPSGSDARLQIVENLIPLNDHLIADEVKKLFKAGIRQA